MDGGYRITPYDPEFKRQMALAASPNWFRSHIES